MDMPYHRADAAAHLRVMKTFAIPFPPTNPCSLSMRLTFSIPATAAAPTPEQALDVNWRTAFAKEHVFVGGIRFLLRPYVSNDNKIWMGPEILDDSRLSAARFAYSLRLIRGDGYFGSWFPTLYVEITAKNYFPTVIFAKSETLFAGDSIWSTVVGGK